MTATRTLVTGGVRSGKSRIAEELLADQPTVTYLAPGPVPDRSFDAEWADRIDAHRARRPVHWLTVETTDIATALGSETGAVLIDCLGTWVTAVVDELGTWDARLAEWQPRSTSGSTGWCRPGAAPGPLVAVTNEVGWSVVPEHRSGRRSGICSAASTSASPRPVTTCCWWWPGECCGCDLNSLAGDRDRAGRRRAEINSTSVTGASPQGAGLPQPSAAITPCGQLISRAGGRTAVRHASSQVGWPSSLCVVA